MTVFNSDGNDKTCKIPYSGIAPSFPVEPAGQFSCKSFIPVCKVLYNHEYYICYNAIGIDILLLYHACLCCGF